MPSFRPPQRQQRRPSPAVVPPSPAAQSQQAVSPPASRPGPANVAPGTRHTFGQYAITRTQAQQGVPHALSEVMQRASADGSHGLDAPVRETLEEHLGHDFSRVQVHSGPASTEAAEALNAQAFTLGRDIYLGAQANTLNDSERTRLLAHEAVHTVQQGGQAMSLQAGLAVSHPTDAAEVEAEQIARSVLAPATGHAPSRSLAMRDQLRASPPRQRTILRTTAPLIQRDLKQTVPGTNGVFIFNFASEDYPPNKTAPGQQHWETGLAGDLTFAPQPTIAETDDIQLMQAVRLIQTNPPGTDYDWNQQPGEAARNDVRTVADPGAGVEEGFFLDTTYAGLAPRASGTPDVSPYYTTTAGKRRGTTLENAVLHDEPMCEVPATFKFETVARDITNNLILAAVQWGFEVTKVGTAFKKKKGAKKSTAQGEVKNEYANVSTTASSATFNAALKNFNDKYNP